MVLADCLLWFVVVGRRVRVDSGRRGALFQRNEIK